MARIESVFGAVTASGHVLEAVFSVLVFAAATNSRGRRGKQGGRREQENNHVT